MVKKPTKAPRAPKKRGKADNPFCLGNELWKKRNRAGPFPKYEGPEDLYLAIVKYFKWTDDNPFSEERAFQYEGRIVHGEVAKRRPYTIISMCHHIGITQRRWSQWREERADLLPVMEWAEEVIFANKFEGAASGFFNSNLIARDLGLADKREEERKMVDKVVVEFVKAKSADE